jgi:hypothetical protein
LPSKHQKDSESALIQSGRTAGGLRRIDLTAGNEIKLFNHEIHDVLMTGTLGHVPTERAFNVVRSVLDDITGDQVNFRGCDVKDTAIRNSRFRDADFGHSSWHYDSISATRFDACSFVEMSMQHCDFDGVTFSDCDLQNNVIKTCRFNSCEFLDCKTNNKLFETSRFTECTFRGTGLQVQTIIENFGLTSSTYQGKIRTERGDGPHKWLTKDQLRRWTTSHCQHPLHGVNVDYFLDETLLNGSHYLDQATQLKNWLPMFRTAGSFTVMLNQWVEFLIWLYEKNRVTVHTLLAFHSMTDELIGALEVQAPERSILSDLSGSHLALARVVDSYLDLLDISVTRSGQLVTLLVEGSGEQAYYRRQLAPLFEHSAGRITSLTPHNSPWEITISFSSAGGTLLFLAMFLATRTSFELSRIREALAVHDVAPATDEGLMRLEAAKSVEQVFALEFGLARPSPRSPGLRLRAYLPGNLLAELKLTVSSRQITKLRTVLKGLL